MPVKIFVSHSHSDQKTAEVFATLLLSVFTDAYVTVSYSSDRSAGGGIEAGEDWLPWILREVRDSAVCIVLLTPESIGKPWLMWEAGAVSGVALANENSTPVVPLLFRISTDQVPGPLRSKQSEYGTNAEGVQRVLQLVHRKVEQPPAHFLNLAINNALPVYLQTVEETLRTRPMALSEGVVQEWCERLDQLREEKRFAEVRPVHQAMLRVFAPPEQKEPAPLDVRLHRRLGDMYLAAKDGASAAAQFELALRLVPNDLYIQHRRALAELEAGNTGVAMDLMQQAEKTDPSVTHWNPEFAGLKGRIYREEWRRTKSIEALRQARDAYWAVMERQPDSYYMADNVGQLSLALGEREKAADAFKRAISAVERLGERSVWSLATLATASFALEQVDLGLRHLQDIANLSPSATARELGSIEDGLARLREALGSEPAVFETWIAALRGRAAGTGATSPLTPLGPTS